MDLLPSAVEELTLVGAMQTHPGLVRSSNEDAAAYVLPTPPNPFARKGSLAIIADGVGGHAAGEVASRLATDIIRAMYYDLSGPPPEVLTACFHAANRAVYERSRADAACAGMATTCTAVAVRDGLAHIGDTRAYILRDGRLRQLSQDHSVVAQLLEQGAMTEAEARHSPYRHIVMRALGVAPELDPLVWNEGLPLRQGDQIILCSDGLSDVVRDSEIAEAATRLPPFEACRALIDAALKQGGRDNVSLGIFAVQKQRPAEVTDDPATRMLAIAPDEGEPE